MVRNTPKKGAPSRTRRDRINKLLIGKEVGRAPL